MKTLLKIFIFITVPVWFLPVGMFFFFRGLYIGIDEDVDAWFNKRKAEKLTFLCKFNEINKGNKK